MNINEKNLLLLADPLETIPQENFSMEQYRQKPSDDPDIKFELVMCHFYSPVNCGSVGCALGHAPLAPGLEPIKDDYDAFSLCWLRYSQRVFGMDSHKENKFEWNFVFSYRWEEYDNTPKGAAARIRYLVKHGRPPVDQLEYKSEFEEAMEAYNKEFSNER